MDAIRVVVVGLGPIGHSCARAVAADRSMQLTGLVDIDPQKAGMTVEELDGSNEAGPGPRVTGDLAEAVSGGADVAVVTTVSRFDAIAPMLFDLLKHRLAVVSSCEQMLWPWYEHKELAGQVDQAAKDAGRAVLGTGVNPGFVMDSLAVVLSSMLLRVTHIRCERRVDASLRRKPLQAKVGATMTEQQFRDLADQGRIGHRGLPESVALLAAGLGHQVEPATIVETLQPHLADRSIPCSLGQIEKGCVAGIHNIAHWQNEDLHIELDLTMAVGIDDAGDTLTLDGPVELTMNIPGSVPGDSATVAALTNHVPVLHTAAPGVRTMLDLPTAGCRGQDR